MRRSVRCSSCNGSGAEPGTEPETCGICNGQGVVTKIANTFLGSVRTQTSCSNCNGTGSVIRTPCKPCSGKGQVKEKVKTEIDVPAGVTDGATMHLPGQGGQGVGGGRSGDLYVVLQVEETDEFERDNQDLNKWIQISFAQAALGDTIEVKGVDETYRLEVSAGTQPGETLVAKGAGLPPLHGGRRGDLNVHINVRVPTKLDETQRAAVLSMSESLGEDAPTESKGGILGGLFKKKR